MAESYTPKWQLNGDWAFDSDKYNWILKRKSGNRWRAEGHYSTVQALLKNFLEVLLKTEPRSASLEKHIEDCYGTAQAATALLEEQIATMVFPECGKRLLPGSTALKKEVGHAS